MTYRLLTVSLLLISFNANAQVFRVGDDSPNKLSYNFHLYASYYNSVVISHDGCDTLEFRGNDFDVKRHSIYKCLYYVRPRYNYGVKKLYVYSKDSIISTIPIVLDTDIPELSIELGPRAHMMSDQILALSPAIIVYSYYTDKYNSAIKYKVLSYVVEVENGIGDVIYTGWSDSATYPDGFKDVYLKVKKCKIIFKNVTAVDDLGNIVTIEEKVFDFLHL